MFPRFHGDRPLGPGLFLSGVGTCLWLILTTPSLVPGLLLITGCLELIFTKKAAHALTFAYKVSPSPALSFAQDLAPTVVCLAAGVGVTAVIILIKGYVMVQKGEYNDRAQQKLCLIYVSHVVCACLFPNMAKTCLIIVAVNVLYLFQEYIQGKLRRHLN